MTDNLNICELVYKEATTLKKFIEENDTDNSDENRKLKIVSFNEDEIVFEYMLVESLDYFLPDQKYKYHDIIGEAEHKMQNAYYDLNGTYKGYEKPTDDEILEFIDEKNSESGEFDKAIDELLYSNDTYIRLKKFIRVLRANGYKVSVKDFACCYTEYLFKDYRPRLEIRKQVDYGKA